MKYWTRTTHNFNNETREWEYVDRLVTWPNEREKEHSTLGIHALISGRWMSLREIVSANEEYYNQYKDDPYSGVRPEGHLEESVLKDLLKMEEIGIIKPKE